jgi:N-acetylmuramoyl-L-alanine amidase
MVPLTPLLALPLLAQPAIQPSGALSGCVVFIGAGHGWTYANTSTNPRWFTQRGVANSMVEDYGNLDQMNLFAEHLWRAGATVVPTRPVGFQTNGVVLDNTSAQVRFTGGWSVASGPVFLGAVGQPAYRFAAVTAGESATAAYVPNLPAAGDYPVYSWVAHGANHVNQLYRIRHLGGETQVRVPHHRVGNGWVWLGTYRFAAGRSEDAGAVIVSNEAVPGSGAGVVVADAIRFGNGLGDIARGPDDGSRPARVSGFPREEEAARYWIEAGLGQGQDRGLFDRASLDDSGDNVGAPIRLAAEMNRESASGYFDRIYVSFHSNAGGGRGVTGLWNNDALFPGTKTRRQKELALGLATELQNEMLARQTAGELETPWFTRTASGLTFARTDYAFGEIRDDTLGGEMDATIVETAFHDSVEDARLLRSPMVRDAMAQATARGLVRHFATHGGGPLAFAPNPPVQVRATLTATGIRVSWNAATSGYTPARYAIYRSADGHALGRPRAVTNALDFTFTDLAPGRTEFFRVAAVNSGGESAPSPAVACRWVPDQPPVLVVNAFDRLDRGLNPRQIINGPVIERVQPHRSNAGNYVVEYAAALADCGLGFDTAHSAAVGSGRVPLADYATVIWAASNESTADETFSAVERERVTAFQQAGGSLLVSGAEVAWHLGRASGSSAAERQFLQNVLHAALLSDLDDDAGTDRLRPAAGAGFDDLGEIPFGSAVGARLCGQLSGRARAGWLRHSGCP